MSKAFWAGVMVGGIILMLYAALHVWANTPVVYESWGSKICIKVEDPEGRYSCEFLPPKYIHEWVA